MFNMGGAVTPGLDAYKGKALQAKNMPMTGIMGFAEGGNPEVEKAKVANAYSGQERLDQGLPAQMFEGIGDAVSGFGQYFSDVGSALGESIPLPLSEEVLQDMPEATAAAEQALTDPAIAKPAEELTTQSNEQLDKAKNKYSAVRAMSGEATGDEATDKQAVVGEFINFAKGLGIDLTPEEADPDVNPDIGMALILAGSKLMQGGTGSTMGDIGQAVETGTSYVANKAEKRAERAADQKSKMGQIALQEFLEAKLGTGRTQADSSLIQYANEYQTSLRDYGIELPRMAALREAKRSAAADPQALIATGAAEMAGDGRAASQAVASNYLTMANNAMRLTSDHGVKDPIVAISRNGSLVPYSTALASIEAQKKASGGKQTDADAMAALGMQARPYLESLKELYPIK